MIDWSQFKPGVGKLLISEPCLPDPNFARTVVLLVATGNEGSLGFVLNRKLELSLRDLGEDYAFFNHSLFEGGPVQLDTLHCIHTFAQVEGALPIKDGVYWGGDFEQIKEKLPYAEKDQVRFFLGYSGWGVGQLEQEISQKTWVVADASGEEIFANDSVSLWRRVMISLGGELSVLANYPMDPSWN